MFNDLCINNKNDLLFVWSLVCYTILKPLNTIFPKISGVILSLNFIFVLYYSLKINSFRFTKYNIRAIIFIIIIFIIHLLDIIFRFNTFSFSYIMNFIIYGFLQIYLLSNIEDFAKVINYFSSFSLITLFIYLWEPFYDYPMTQNYMGYGFNGMLPAYIGIYLMRKKFNKKFFIILEGIIVFNLLLFANKSSLLTAIIFVVIYELFFVENNLKKILSITFFTICIYFLLINIVEILLHIKTILSSYELSSYSINTLIAFFKDGVNTSQLSRDVFWENAEPLINSHLLFGIGIGKFQSLFKIYPHNILLDILLNIGVIGFIVVLSLFINTFIKIYKKSYTINLFLLICLTMIIPLFFSSTYYTNTYFWIFLFLGIISDKFRKEEINE